jgi:transcriptional regulator with XRE-family HTH domain
MDVRVDGERIRLEREKRAWSQEHLAGAAGIGVRTIQRIEATGVTSYESVRAIAAALQMPVTDLRTGDGPSQTAPRSSEFDVPARVDLGAAPGPTLPGAARVRLACRCFAGAAVFAVLAGTSGFLLLEDYRQVRVLRTLELWVTDAAPATAAAERVEGR